MGKVQKNLLRDQYKGCLFDGLRPNFNLAGPPQACGGAECLIREILRFTGGLSGQQKA